MYILPAGVENAPEEARALKAGAFALFTKNQWQWVAAPLTVESIDRFRQRCDEYGYAARHILPHDSYLINLGNRIGKDWRNPGLLFWTR